MPTRNTGRQCGLDLARYADTVGYSGDEKRDIWPWRDWLIRSLAANKSYKDLSIEMLAGDLLPGATNDQRLATAFHRNTLSNNEGGTNDEEFRTIAVKDRLSTTINAWMGLDRPLAPNVIRTNTIRLAMSNTIRCWIFLTNLPTLTKGTNAPKLAVFPEPDPSVSQALQAQDRGP